MILKKVTAAVAALMLTTSPVMAQSLAVPAPQTEEVEGLGLAPTNQALGIIIGVTVVVLALLILIDDDEDAESP